MRDLSKSLNCSFFIAMKSGGEIIRCQIKKGADTNGSLRVAVPETANTTEYGGSDCGCNIHHSNTGH